MSDNNKNMRDTEIGRIVWNYFIENYAGNSQYMYFPIPPYGKVMKYFRTQKKLTQQQVAQKLGVSQNTYSKLENGLVEPSDERIEDISDILDFDLYELEKISYRFYDEYGFHNRKEVDNLKLSVNGLIDDIERLEKLLESKEETIQLLKEKIAMLESKNNK
jgi:transcriptional regulator with XRE-family HTH domain